MIIKKKIVQTPLDQEIDVAIKQLQGTPLTDETYEIMAKNLILLYKAKAETERGHISKETLLTVGGNLAGILLILNYEKFNVISSKALSFILKPKI